MHISLDSALGRQRRLNSVGESVLQIAPNAAAAYSLRSLTGGDPKVVRVRRATDNHEQDFTASEVSSGALTSFVNGELESTLPADVDTASAAYSLRQVKDGYGVPVDNYPGVNLPSAFGVTLEYNGINFSVKETGNDFLVNYIGSTVFISPSGNDSSGNGSSANPYKTLDKAIAVASDNDKISLASGIYSMPTSDVNKSVAIVCPSGTAYVGTFNNLSSATIDTIDTNTYDVYNVDDVDAGETFKGYLRTDGTLISGVRGSAISSTSDISQDYASKGIMSVRSGSTSANFVTGTSETLQSLVSAGSILAWTDGSTDNFTVSTGKNVYVGSNIILASFATNVVETAGTSEIVLDGCEVYGGSNSTVNHHGSGRLLMFNTIVSGSNTDNIDYDNTAIGIEVNVTSSWCNRGTSDNTSTGHSSAKVLRVGGTYRGGSRTVHDVNNVDIYVFSCTIGDALGNDKIYLRIGGTSSPEDATLNYGNVTFLNTYNISGITELSVDEDAVAFNRVTSPESEILGSVTRIRRGSDSIEVNVKFDSNKKISSSSSVENIAEQGGEGGSTNANNLNLFLNETLTVGTALNGTGSFPYDSFTANGNTGFTVTNDGTAMALFPYVSAVNDVVVVNFDINITDGSPSPSVATRSSTSSVNTKSNATTISSSGNYNATMTATADGTHIGVSDGNTGSYTISNFKIVSHTHSAFVHTWYDQVGSNNAVQATASNQPKIAENGELLADGLDFDGSNDEMALTSALGSTTTQSIFAVQKNDITTGTALLFDNRDADNDGSAIFATDSAGKKQSSWDAADAEHTANTNEELISLIKTSSAIKIIANAVEKSSTSSSSTIDISNVPKIGASFSSSNHYDGSIKELICYNSDQSSNIFKIESNINNYYDVYTFSGNGFVETWYDQSGNSNDVTQATAGSQPKIVNAGSLVVDSAGLPEIDFDGSNDCLTASSYSRSGEDLPLTMISVFDQDVAGVDYVVALNQTDNNAFDRILLRTNSFDYGRRATDNTFKAGSGSDPDVNTKYLFTAINAGTTSSGFVDGSSIFSGVDTNVGTQAMNQIDIGLNNGDSSGGANPFDGKMQEIIIYETDQSDNRLALEANIMTNYGIS